MCLYLKSWRMSKYKNIPLEGSLSAVSKAILYLKNYSYWVLNFRSNLWDHTLLDLCTYATANLKHFAKRTSNNIIVIISTNSGQAYTKIEIFFCFGHSLPKFWQLLPNFVKSWQFAYIFNILCLIYSYISCRLKMCVFSIDYIVLQSDSLIFSKSILKRTTRQIEISVY